MRPEKLLGRIKHSPTNIRFSDLCRLAETLGFRLKGQRGSHRVYSHPGVKEFLNLQEVSGQAKPYQVRQFLAIVEKYALKLMED